MLKRIQLLVGLMVNGPKAAINLAISFACALAGGFATTALLAHFQETVKSQAVTPYVWYVFFALVAAHGILNFWAQYSITVIAQHAVRDLRVQLARRIMRTPYENIEQIGRSTLVETVAQTTNTLLSNLESLPGFVTKLITALVLIAYLFWISPFLLGLTAVGMTIGALVYLLPMASFQKYAHQRYDADEKARTRMIMLVDGVKELSLGRLRQSDYFNRYLLPALDRFVEKTKQSRFIDYGVRRWGEVYIYTLAAVLLFWVPSAGLAGYPEVISFTVVMLFAVDPVTTVINFSFFNLRELQVALDRVDAIGLSLSHDLPENDEIRFDNGAHPDLRLQNVSYTFHHAEKDEEFTLGPISFETAEPAVIFITGGNGSGKSTLAKILCGLYRPQSGSLLVNGVPVTGTADQNYRELFSVVFFDFYLFPSVLGTGVNHDDERANRYVGKLHLQRKLFIRESEFSTADLSQGQRKRLALLTAYMDDRPFYLFDEWAADQDPQFKKIFYQELLPELKARGKTVFVITHDDAYFHTADRVIHLEEGKIVSDRPQT